MEKYNKDHDLIGLVETLKLLAGITAMSSPLDNSLFQKKKDHQHEKKKKNDEKNDKTKADTQEDEMDVQVNECDFGNSPVFVPKTMKKKKGK